MPEFRFRHLHVLKYDVCTAKAMYPREKCVVWGWQGGGKNCASSSEQKHITRKQKSTRHKKTCRLLSSASHVPFPSHHYMRGAGTGLHCIDFFHSTLVFLPAAGQVGTSRVQSEHRQSVFESAKGGKPRSCNKRRRNHTQHHTQDAWTTTWWSILAGVPGRRSLKGLRSGAANKGGPHDVHTAFISKAQLLHSPYTHDHRHSHHWTHGIRVCKPIARLDLGLCFVCPLPLRRSHHHIASILNTLLLR